MLTLAIVSLSASAACQLRLNDDRIVADSRHIVWASTSCKISVKSPSQSEGAERNPIFGDGGKRQNVCLGDLEKKECDSGSVFAVAMFTQAPWTFVSRVCVLPTTTIVRHSLKCALPCIGPHCFFFFLTGSLPSVRCGVDSIYFLSPLGFLDRPCFHGRPGNGTST